MLPITFKQYLVLSIGLLMGLFVHLLNVYDFYLYHIIMHVTITKASTMIITNAGLMFLYFFGKVVLNMFVGRLRDMEIEEIIDQGRMFLLDTIFFLLFSSPTIDNVEVGAMVISRYITLVLILKLLHLISHIRINHMFELDRPKTLNIIRMAVLLNILLAIDVSLVFKYYGLLSKDSTLRLWIFFESVSLFVSCTTSVGKYLVQVVDLKLQAIQIAMRQEEEFSDQISSSGIQAHNFVWSNKNATLFYMEVFGDACSLITYLLFIILFLVFNPSRIPLYIMGDIFHVLKALYGKLSSFRRYRKLTKNIETRLQNATLEEIERIDTCISWFIQQQTCPICRSAIIIQDEETDLSNSSDETAFGGSERPEDGHQIGVNFEGVSSSGSSREDPDRTGAVTSSLNFTSDGDTEANRQLELRGSNSIRGNSRFFKNLLKSWFIGEYKTPACMEILPNKGTKINRFQVSEHILFKQNQEVFQGKQQIPICEKEYNLDLPPQ
ncbi:putative ERAD-associated E3 ubiquitin-protein ligase HRD1, partial [Cryptosporidium felis]